ncbi:MAG: amino acid adenylation domain-containing protein [Chloroflexota bacterium]
MLPATSLAAILRKRSYEQADQCAYTFLADGEEEEKHLSYAQLDLQARAIASLIQERAQPGERALLLYPPGLDYIAAFFGCLYAGVIAVPAYPPRLHRADPRLQAIVTDAKATLALSTHTIFATLEQRFTQTPELASLHWLTTDPVDSGHAANWQAPALTADSLAFLQYTSGSTSAPRGVKVSHGNLLHNLEMIYHCFGGSPTSQGVIWLPPYHDMGLIGGILQPLYGGFPVTLLSPTAFLQAPIRWLKAISRYRATISGGPDFAYNFCVDKITPEQRAGLDLRHWDLAFNGAEPIRAETLERFAAAFAECGFRKEAFYPCYGLAEATLIASGGQKGDALRVRRFQPAALARHEAVAAKPGDAAARRLVSCGYGMAQQRLQIVEPETGAPCPPGRVGEIWLAGPSVAHGYWGRPAESRQTFGARLAGGQGGDTEPYLRTGDLGFLHDGELFITGRLKDLIIIRGRNHYPQDVELTAGNSHPALAASGGAAFSVDTPTGEQLVIVHELERQARNADAGQVAAAVRQAVAEQHELQVYAVVLLRPGHLPRTSSGKVQRRACRRAFLEGSLEAIATDRLPAARSQEAGPPDAAAWAALPPEERRAALAQFLQLCIAQAAGLPPAQVTPEQPIVAFGIDSLAAVGLQHRLERELGMALSLTHLLEGANLNELVETALVQQGTQAEAIPVCEPRDRAAGGPLSHGQQAMWFLHQLAPESAAYHLAYAFRILPPFDRPRFRQVVETVAARHPMLSATFAASERGPVQQVCGAARIDIIEEDATAWDAQTLQARLAAEAQRPFDLANGPLLRLFLFPHAQDEHVLLAVVHHSIADFWSLAALMQELAGSYAAPSAGLPAHPIEYGDYVHWQNARLSGPEGERLWRFWQRQLAGPLPPLALPTDHPRQPVQTYRGGRQTAQLSRAFTENIKRLSAAHQATPFMTLLAAFQALLHRYTQETDILVGTPTAGRSHPDLAGLVGYFVNPIVLRANLAGNPAFSSFLAQVRQTVLEAFEHQDYPLPLLVERLQPARDPSRTPLFQALFSFQKAPAGSEADLAAFALGQAGVAMRWGALNIETLAIEPQTAQFDLALSAGEVQGRFGLALHFNADLFEPATIRHMLAHYQALLEAIAANPQAPVSALAPLPPEEWEQRQRWNDTAAPIPPGCIHHLFERWAMQTPDQPAVMCGGEAYSYGELNRQANRLANFLCRQGIGPEMRVAVCLERSASIPVALLGILKAGSAYLPLDPGFPPQRLAYMLADAQVSLVLTQESLRVQPALQTLWRESGRPIFCLDADWPHLAEESTAAPPVYVGPDNLAYVIYTSGSTGQPKGVQVPHRAVVNFLTSMQREPGMTARDTLLSVTTLSFDIAGLELFLPLASGARVAIAGRDATANGAGLADLLEACDATLMQATPATWRLLLEAGWSGKKNLKALCGGEAFPRPLADELRERCASVWNMYGPTETTIWSSTARVEAGAAPVPLGRPVANTQIHLLDRHGQPVPDGVAGELCIGGMGLARGYLRQPGLSAEKFIPDPFSGQPGARLYRTGDLARFRTDGGLEFLGRNDHQVKVRGHRIELPEIESALCQHPSVEAAVAIARQDTPGNVRLVAYPIFRQGTAPAAGELRQFLKDRLPEYMLPAAFVPLAAFPLTPNGKIDRAALPAPDGQRPDLPVNFTAPQSQIEQIIARAWQDALQLDRVGVHDNFFDLGGHSLLMAQVHHRLQEKLQREIPLVALFQYATIHSLAVHLGENAVQAQALPSQAAQRAENRAARQDAARQERLQRQKNRLKY